jgi:hypothetical protein
MAKVGDRIEVLDGANYGKQGTVTVAYDDGRIEAKVDDPTPLPLPIAGVPSAPDTLMLSPDQYRLI